uniref:Uncharacterized protein n=1 Tax=Anguilla anguilla TaxID=7936 RepID=A0A0E9W4P1_ANGAN
MCVYVRMSVYIYIVHTVYSLSLLSLIVTIVQ